MCSHCTQLTPAYSWIFTTELGELKINFPGSRSLILSWREWLPSHDLTSEDSIWKGMIWLIQVLKNIRAEQGTSCFFMAVHMGEYLQYCSVTQLKRSLDPSPLVFCISLCPLFCHCCFEDPKNRISSPGEFYVPLAIDGTFCFLLYGEGWSDGMQCSLLIAIKEMILLSVLVHQLFVKGPMTLYLVQTYTVCEL